MLTARKQTEVGDGPVSSGVGAVGPAEIVVEIAKDLLHKSKSDGIFVFMQNYLESLVDSCQTNASNAARLAGMQPSTLTRAKTQQYRRFPGWRRVCAWK